MNRRHLGRRGTHAQCHQFRPRRSHSWHCNRPHLDLYRLWTVRELGRPRSVAASHGRAWRNEVDTLTLYYAAARVGAAASPSAVPVGVTK